MAPPTTPLTDDPFRALRWLAEAGAGEALDAAPVNRLALRAPAAADAMLPRSNDARVRSGDDERGAGPGPMDRAASPPSTPPAARRVPATPAAPTPPAGDAEARRLAARCDSLDALRAALLSLDQFALKKTARNLVLADGNPDSGIVFVGEAPGRDEDEQGLPFVGRSGKLLDRMLAAIGLDRTRCYITNVVVWRPPGNREPTPDEFAVLEPFFQRHLELLRPRVIVTLGGVPARHVLGRAEAVTRIRGRWHNARVGDGDVPVMPTLHPAFLLRSPAQKRLVWRDLLTLRERLDSPGTGSGA